MRANKCQKEKIMTLKEANQKDGQRHLYVKSAIITGTTQYVVYKKSHLTELYLPIYLIT